MSAKRISLDTNILFYTIYAEPARSGEDLGGGDDLLDRRQRDEARGSRERPRRDPATCP